MESEEFGKATSSAQRREESAAGRPPEAASPRRCVSGVLSSPAQSSPASGWSLADLEQQRRARLHPAAAAVHLVPDIVVEHVSSSTFSDSGISRQPSSCGSLSPADVFDVCLTTGRPLRALSDSSVYPLERYRQSTDTRRTATCPVHSSASPDQFSPAVGTVKSAGDDTAAPKLEMDIFGSECPAQETWGSVPMPRGVQPAGGLVWQPSLPSPQSLGPERSPKANWLRRHSDSNLTFGHSWQAGLRIEPYPIRSHSTGDTLPTVASSREQSLSRAAAGESLFAVPKESVPDRGHSERQRTTIPSHLWSTAGRSWQQRASPAARKFFSEGYKPSVTHAEVLHPYGRSRSENISSSEFFLPTEKTGNVERQMSGHVEAVDHPAVAAAELSTEQTKIVDMSMLERGSAAGKTDGLVEKRLKLKKYLQTRYQMSQDRLQQSTDVDDVFMERVSTPERSAGVSEPTDLSTRARSIPAEQSTSDVAERTGELYSSKHFAASASFQEPSDPRTFHPASERSLFPLFVKREPTSPGIVPSGASVFVFPPPAVPSHHDSAEWYHPACHHSASPVPSPLSTGVSESHHATTAGVLFPRFFRQPSFPGEEAPYRAAAAGLRMGHHPGTGDVSAIRHRLACSLDISTDASPLALSATPHRSTVAGPEVMSASARLSLAESLRHRLRSGSRWHRHQLGGSSVEDPASFACPACSAVFTSYRHLADHMADHVTLPDPGDASEAGSESGSGSKAVHLCPICQRSFSRGDMLTRHVRLHTGIRPYECSLCSQVSPSHSVLPSV